MTISSRTPEGEPNRCPLCQADVSIEHSALFGDATCPKCGTLLWHVGNPSEPILFEHATSESIRERMIQAAAARLGVDPEKLRANPSLVEDLDSLDTVELVMELEEEFDS